MTDQTEPTLPDRGDWMQTYTGRAFYPMYAYPADVHSLDIAHALSLLCRYGGHVRRFYSVAEHCVLMSETFEDREVALWALLHDATEAYMGDMIRPLKRAMPEYREAEDRLMLAIGHAFGLYSPWKMPPEVKDADNRILLDERAALMTKPYPLSWSLDGLDPLGVTITGWLPREAEVRWLDRLAGLTA